MLLLGILSGVAFSRLGSSNAFEPAMLMQQVDEQLRLAQKLATARQDGQITFYLRQVGDEWETETTSAISGSVFATRTSRNNSNIIAANGVLATPITAANSLALEIDGLGNLNSIQIGADTGDTGLGVELQISGDSTRTLCIYSSGYVSHHVCS